MNITVQKDRKDHAGYGLSASAFCLCVPATSKAQAERPYQFSKTSGRSASFSSVQTSNLTKGAVRSRPHRQFNPSVWFVGKIRKVVGKIRFFIGVPKNV